MTCKLLLALAMSAIVLVGCDGSKDAMKRTVAEIVKEKKERVSYAWCYSYEVTNVFLVEESSDRYTGWVTYEIRHKDTESCREQKQRSYTDAEWNRVCREVYMEGRLEVTVFVDGDEVMVQANFHRYL